MKKIKNPIHNVSPVFDKQSNQRAADSTEHRIDKLETTIFRLFGFLLGMILTHIIIHTF